MYLLFLITAAIKKMFLSVNFKGYFVKTKRSTTKIEKWGGSGSYVFYCH